MLLSSESFQVAARTCNCSSELCHINCELNISAHLRFEPKAQVTENPRGRLSCTTVALLLPHGMSPECGRMTSGWPIWPHHSLGTDTFTVLSEAASSTRLAIANDICRERKYFAQLFCFSILF